MLQAPHLFIANIAREDVAVRCIYSSAANPLIGAERRECFFRGVLVLKGDGGSATRPNHPCHGRKLIGRIVAKCHYLVYARCSASQDERHAARKQRNKDQFSPN